MAAVCKATPNEKTATATMRDFRRPILSARGAANRAPKKVPALRIDTISEDWVGVIAGKPLPSRCPVENWSSHHLMAMIPLIVLHVHCQRPQPSASLLSCDPESLPSIVSKQYASEGDEATDHDGRRRRPGHALGLPPRCHGDRHGVSAVPSSGPDGLAESIAQGISASTSPLLLPVLSMVVGGRVEESKRQRSGVEGIRFGCATQGLIG